ncbi:PREDICTED: uncharacterized protein LOC108545591 [Eufriesea mexicana]|uniref:uncharacterized protein LOC108545591 n=1 Tax=Eufriesea mexicana TaxID=516756 RepID=UPI00083BB447|nr:PREDICTED: uncharacterized protein LOC108545591 [Eufriesea mexicana]
MVIWPILNKVDEKQYRMEIKEYLEILANENPDVNFPPIFMSHLLQAGGTKFLILMWKISEISLRTYITREYQIKLLQAPNIGDTKDIVQKYFTTINIKRDHTISKFHEKIQLNLQLFKHYIQYKSINLAKVQSAIFEVKSNVEKLTSILPVNPLIAKRLTDIDDTEIINLWKESIDENIKSLSQINLKLKKLKTLSNTLYELPHLTNWNLEIPQHCKTIKFMEEIYKKFIVQVSDNLYDIQCNLQEKTINYTLDTDSLQIMNLQTILNSPKHNVSTTAYIDNEKMLTNILASPLEGKYKHLFKRYKCNSFDSHERSMTKYQFNNTIDSIKSNWESPQKHLLIWSPNKMIVSPKYSKLFSTSASKTNYFKVSDNNAASTPNRRNITSKKSNIQTSNTQRVDIDTAIKNIFDLSSKITNVVISLSKS